MTKKAALRFAGFGDEWNEVKLGEVTDIKTGGRDVQDSVEDGLYPFYIRSEEVKRINSYSFDGEAILIPGEGRLGEIFHYANGKFDVHQRVYKISNFTDVNAKFVLQQMKKDFKQHAMRNTVKATVDSLRLPTIQSFTVFVSSLPEQTAIGSFFQDIDQLISLQQRKLEVLKEQKKTYLKLFFPAKGQTRPALRFAGFEDEWKEVKLGEVFDIVTDYVANGSFESLRNNVRTYEKDNFAYMIRLQDASNSWKGPWLYTDEKGYNFLSKSRLFKDDILMSNVGTVGRFFQVPELDRPMTLAPNSVLIRSTSSNNQFLYFMMLTANIQDQITMRKTPGVQDKINKTDFKKVIATLPALSEQEAIGSFFQDLDKAIAKQEEKVNQLKESKQTLLRKMFI